MSFFRFEQDHFRIEYVAFTLMRGQYSFSAESYNQYLLCVRITTYPRAVWDMETSPNHLLNCFRVMFSRKTVLLNITLCFCERKRVKKARF